LFSLDLLVPVIRFFWMFGQLLMLPVGQLINYL
jgi:hypothetical protein